MKREKIYKWLRYILLLFPLVLLLICCIWYKQIIEGLYIHYENYNITINQNLQSTLDSPYKLWLYLFLGGGSNSSDNVKSYLPFWSFFENMVNFFNSKFGASGTIYNSFFSDYFNIPPYILLPSIYLVYSVFIEIIFVIIDLLLVVIRLFKSVINKGLNYES